MILRAFLFALLLATQATPTRAAVITSTTAGGAWTATSTWIGGVVPLSTDSVVIAAGSTVTTGGSRSCAGLTIDGTLGMAAGNVLTVNGNVTGSGTWTTAATTTRISLTGNWSFDGISTGNGATATFTGAATQTLSGRITTGTGALIVNKTGGSLTLGSDITIGAFTLTAGTFDAAAFLLTAGTPTLTAGTLRVGASDWTGNYSFTPVLPVSFTIQYYNPTPTIHAAIAYRNLAFAGSGTAGANGPLTIQGNLTNTGGGTLDFGANNVTISSTAAAQSIAGFTTTGTVSMTKTGGTATFTGSVTGGNLTVNGTGGTLNLGAGLVHTFTGTWTRTAGTLNGGTSTLNLGGSVAGTGGTFSASAGTVNYNGTGAQTIAGLAYYNLQTGTGGTKMLAAATTVLRTLTVGAGTTLDTANFAVTLNGSFVNNGTFTAGSSNITIAGTSANPTIAGFSTSGALNFTRTASTATLTGNVNVGSLTINGTGGTLNLGTGLTHTITGTWTRTAGTLNGGTSTLNLGGSVAGTGGTFTRGTGTVNYNGAGAQTIAALNYYNLQTGTGGTKMLAAATTVAGSLTVGAGTTLDTASFAITMNRNFVNNGTFAAGSSNITFGGNAAQSIAGFTTTGTVTLAKTGNTATFIGNVNGGGLVINGTVGTATLNLGAGLTHQFNGPVTLTLGTLNGGSSTLGLTGNFIGNSATFTAGTGSVVFNGTAVQTINRNGAIVFYNLTVNNAAGVVNNLLTGATTVNGALTLANGVFTLTTGLTMGNGATIVRDLGSLSAAPTFGAAVNVTYAGTAAVVSGNELPAAATVLNNLTLNKPAGVTLAAGRTVNGTLTLNSGNLTTGANILTIAATGAAAGASPASYVIGNLQKNFSTGPRSFTFPIGDAVGYAPVLVSFASVGTAGSLTVTTTAGQHPDIASSNINPARDVNRFWTLAPGGGLTITTYGATFGFPAGDVIGGADPTLFSVQRFLAAWSTPTIGTRTATSTQATGMTAFGSFAVGEAPGTTTAVACAPNPVLFPAGATCSATVSRTSGTNTPTGTVAFSSSGIGSFVPAACLLAGAGGVAACSVDYTPAAVGTGMHTILGSYGGDSNFAAGGGDTDLSVDEPPSTSGISGVAADEDGADTAVDLWFAFADSEDSDGDLTYTLAGNSNPGLFASVSVTGAPGQFLNLAYTPDGNGSADLTVRATDTDGLWVETAFTVIVNPVNDAPTANGIADVVVTEDAADTSIDLWPAFADLEDPAGSLTYTLTGNTDPSLFASASVTGAPDRYLLLAYAPDRSGSAGLTVRATDGGGLWVETAFTVTVNPANDAPTTGGIGGVTVNEESPDTIVDLWPSFADLEDTDGSLAYTMTNNTAPALFTSVSVTGGPNQYLVLNYAPHAYGSAAITVRATDTGGLWVETSLSVAIDPINDEPSFDMGGDQSAAEDAGLRTLLNWATNISAGPANESGQVLTFVVVNDNNGLFSVQPAIAPDGTLTFMSALNAAGSATVTVVDLHDDGGTADGGDDSYTPAANTFTVSIMGANDPPSTSGIADAAVSEDAPATSIDLWPSFADLEDADSALAYTVTGNDNPGLFSSVTIGGMPNRYAVLNFTPNAYGSANVTVRAADTGGLWAQATFRVTIAAVPDSPTDILLANATVPEAQPAGTVVGTLSSTDPDPADSHAYTLVDTPLCPGPGNAAFQIGGPGSDELQTAGPLDYETASSYVICLLSTDGAGLSYRKQFTITVSGANETPTGVSLSNDRVAELQMVGTPVGNLGSIDLDAGDTHTYSLQGSIPGCSGADNVSFRISGSQLQTNAIFDYEAKSSFAVCIRTADAGGLTYEQAFTILVTDVDEGDPTVTATTLTAVVIPGPVSFSVTFSEDVSDPPGNLDPEDVTNRANYLLVEKGANEVFDTVSCADGRLADDVPVTVNSVAYSNSGGAYVATVSINGGEPLAFGDYRLHVCGTTSVVDLAGNPINGGLDYIVDFAVGRGAALPATGFAPDRVTVLPPQPAAQAYDESPLQLEIPKLGLSMAIVGVPMVDGDWDVSWLGNRAGWLQGTAFPTWAGNSVITGHVWDAYNRPGLFADLNRLWWGDQIIVRGWGQQYVFEVRSVQVVGPADVAQAFKHEEYNWLTLLTCRGYDPDSGTYRSRLIVRAVLVKIK